MIKNCRKQLENQVSNQSLRNDMLQSIYYIQIAGSEAEFNILNRFFSDKYKPIAPTFIAYYEKEWLQDLKYWFKGAHHLFPSNNNGLEGANNSLKVWQFRDRLPVNEFISSMIEYVHRYSIERNADSESSFSSEILLTTKVHTDAYLWAKTLQQREYNAFETDAGDRFLVVKSNSSDSNVALRDLLEMFLKRNQTWPEDGLEIRRNHFISAIFLKICESSVECSCSEFLKNYICKHSLGIMQQLEMVNVPEEATLLPLGVKRKPGRPKKALSALQFQ